MLRIAVFSLLALICSFNSADAIYSVTDSGTWPKTWPAQLEPLRKQARTLVGSASHVALHEIPFTSREQFEAVWPQIVSLKSKGAPIILLRGPDKRLGELKAGVRIRAPQTGNLVTPTGQIYPAGAEKDIADKEFLKIGPSWPKGILNKSGEMPQHVVNVGGMWKAVDINSSEDLIEQMKAKRLVVWARIEIELIVDGDVVDLNRIPLPADTPIVDKRFEQEGSGAK